ncbi:Dihydroorotase, homodimeric type [Venustampulla echinocandica]|uniref:dihydroorotase n=1 Tax=Venustampulla echinocandica TaxID=2656787 RepID=A0A370TZ98_9HELO|nr:Dihydroorotase, homodimeric type [Venustampulla echinocandica]RDL40863.1 Dihydroorotase, homodimeric type [Venustampulla echinocandica]
MDLRSLGSLELPLMAAFHVRLRDGKLRDLVTPVVKDGRVGTVYAMPNLTPPIATVAPTLSGDEKLLKAAAVVIFLGSLFLNPTLTPELIAHAAETSEVYGIKLYPAGVHANSANGVLDIMQYYPIFEAMQEHNMVLNLHGKAVSSSPDTTALNAEHKFLPQLHKLHAAFPRLRIVLEHVSTRAGLDAVRQCGPTVAGTITAHHLRMTTENAEQDCFNLCKPVAKDVTLDDRIALVRAVVEGSPKFFFASKRSDCAPHPAQAKNEDGAAGCPTQGSRTSLVLGALEEGLDHGWITEKEVTMEAIESFLSKHGGAFYQIPEFLKSRIQLERRGETVPELVTSKDDSVEVVPFRCGKEIWTLTWIN